MIRLANIILISVFMYPCTMIRGQNTVTITGTVTAFRTYPLANCTIISKQSGNATRSDSSGRFILECHGRDELLITANGFKDRTVRIKNASPVSVNLDYQYSRNSFNGAVSNHHITTEDLREALHKFPDKAAKDYSRYQNIYELVRNEFITLRADGNRIYNTKASSFVLSSEVLYVVDGMVVSDISFISPAEVEKIEFHDDAQASEYGVRGANGVLKITLRKE